MSSRSHNGANKPAHAKPAQANGAAQQGRSAIERVRLARHPSRPQTLDYIDGLFSEFFEIHGDRNFRDDGAIVAGLAYLETAPVAIVGQQRGRSTADRIKRNFGKPHPEGYRKAGRVYELAGRFRLPLITFIDTQGAESGAGAEERGQVEAIAHNLETMARLEVPSIAVLIGEGSSGGAIALGVANVVLIQENACYTVITPEGCAAILWREATEENVARAADALRLSAPDLLRLGVVDEIIAEPEGGAHTNPTEAIASVGAAIKRHLTQLVKLNSADVRKSRERKFAAMGSAFLTTSSASAR